MKSHPILRALAPFAAGYFTSYLFRVVNAAISDDLIAELSLSNTDLGLMTSMYLYGFVLFQLPLGLLLIWKLHPLESAETFNGLGKLGANV